MTAPRRTVPAWQPCFRAVPSRYPTVSLFDAVASADELDAVFAVQALTNPRLRQEAGEISLVAPAERVAGPGSTPVMAAFTHVNRAGSRFSDGTWGVYYAADSLAAAVSEVGFHCGRFLGATRQPAVEVDYRAYVGGVCEPLHDIRGPRWHAVHDADSYDASVRLARELRGTGSWGLLYRSVRHVGAECVAVFRPRAMRLPVTQGAHVALTWDGSRISGWYEKSGHRTIGA